MVEGGAACTKSLSVMVPPHTIQLQQGRAVLVDGIPVTLPHTISDVGVNIIHASSLFVQVILYKYEQQLLKVGS